MLFKKNIASPQGLGKNFFKTPKALAIKEKVDKFNYINMKKKISPQKVIFLKVKENRVGKHTVLLPHLFL